MAKAMTLRIPEERAAELEAIARADQVPVSETVRAAIDREIEARRADKEFQARIKEMMRENEQVLKRLAG